MFTHFDAVVGKSTKSFNEIAHVTVNARDKFTSFSNSVENVGISTLRTTEAFGGLNKAAGGLPGILLNVAGALDNIADKSNALGANFKVATSQIGGFGTAALLAGAAFTGWQIGKIISEGEGLARTLQEIINVIPGLEDVSFPFYSLSGALKTASEQGGKLLGWLGVLNVGAGFLAKVMGDIQRLTGVTEDQTQRQALLNEQLRQSLWERYGKEVDIAGLSVEEAANKLNRAASELNSINVILSNAITDIGKAVDASLKRVEESQMSTGALLARRRQESVDAIKQLGAAKTEAEIEAAQKLLMAITNDAASLRIREAAENKSRTDAAIKEAERRANELIKQEQALTALLIKAQQERTNALIKDNARTGEIQQEITGLIDSQVAGYMDLYDAVFKYGDGVNAINPALQEEYKQLVQVYHASLEVSESQIQAEIAMQQMTQAAQEQAQALAELEKWMNVFSTLSRAIPGLGGQIMGFAETFMQTGINLVKNGATTTQAYAGAIGSVLSQIGAQVEGLGGTFLRVGGAVAQGFATGGPWGAVIAGLAAVASELMGLFSHDWGEDVGKQLNALLPGIQISDDLRESIIAMAKETGDSSRAVIMHLGQIIDQVGVTKDNFFTLAQAAHDVFSFLEREQITQAEAAEILQASFTDLEQAAAKFGGAYQNKIVEIINLTRQFGLEVQAVTEYVNKQISTLVDTSNSLADNLASSMERFTERFGEDFQVPMEWSLLTSGADPSELAAKQIKKIEAQFDTLAFFVSNSIAQITANGGTLADVFAQMGPSIDVLRDAWEKFGFDVDSSLMKFLDMQDIITGKLEKTISQVSAVGSGLQALGNLGIAPTAKEFDKFGDSVDRIYHRIIKGGGDQKLALAQVLPQLRIINQLQQQFGLEVDKGTQKLLDQAAKAGLLTDPQQQALDIQQKQLDVMLLIADALGVAADKTAQFRLQAQGVATTLGNIPNTIPITFTLSGAPPPPGEGGFFVLGGQQGPSYAGITEPHFVTGTERDVTLHSGEAVLDRESAREFRSGGGATFNINVSARTKEDAKFVAAVVKEEVKRIQRGETPWDDRNLRQPLRPGS